MVYETVAASRESISSRNSGDQSPSTSLRQLELSEAFPEDVDDRPGLARHQRSSTISTMGGFEFQSNLLPLTPSGDTESHQDKGEEKHVGLLHGPFGSHAP